MDVINSFATGGIAEIGAFVGNFLALIVIGVVLYLFALRSGRPAFVSLVLSLYAGYALYAVFPYKEAFLGEGQSDLTKAVAALIVFGVFTFVPFMLMSRVMTSGLARIHPLALALLAFLAAGLVLAIGYEVLHVGAILPLTPPLAALFSFDTFFFWWFVAPLVGLFVLSR